MKKRSFFERLTGSVNIDEDESFSGEHEDADEPIITRSVRGSIARDDSRALHNGKIGGSIAHGTLAHGGNAGSTWLEEQAGDGELSVDVYQTDDEVIVRAMIPGVRKEDVDISISRDSVTIRGTRKEDKMIADDNYIVRELYWGTFSRTVRLPHEVDIEHADALETQGLLTIKLPRVDKDRQAKLKIKSI